MESTEAPMSIHDPAVVDILRKVYMAGIDQAILVMKGILAQPNLHHNDHLERIVNETLQVLVEKIESHKQAAAEEAIPYVSDNARGPQGS